MSDLRRKQSRFLWYVHRLIEWAYDHGYELTAGELYRTPEQARWNAEKGLGIANSLHTQRLAIDLNLFKDGELLGAVAAYRPLGEFWKALSHDCAWGGDFSRPDPAHFSISHNGVK